MSPRTCPPPPTSTQHQCERQLIRTPGHRGDPPMRFCRCPLRPRRAHSPPSTTRCRWRGSGTPGTTSPHPRGRQPRGSAAGADLALAPKHATRTTYPRRIRAPKITTRPDQGLEQPIPAPLSDSGHDSPHLPAHPPRGLGVAPPQHRCASLPPTYRHTRGRSEGWRARERRLSWPPQRPTAAARRLATNKTSATCWGCPTAPPIWATSAADLVDLRTARHNPIPASCESPHTSCRTGGGTVQPSHAGRTARPAPAPAVPPRGQVEPPARTPPMHSARSREGAAACTAAVPR